MLYFFKPTKFKIWFSVIVFIATWMDSLAIRYSYFFVKIYASLFKSNIRDIFLYSGTTIEICISLIIFIILIYILSCAIYWLKNIKTTKALGNKIFYLNMLMFFISMTVLILIYISYGIYYSKMAVHEYGFPINYFEGN